MGVHGMSLAVEGGQASALVEMATSNQLRVVEADASSSVPTFGTCKLHAARPSATSTAMAWLDEEVQARPGKSGASDLLEEPSATSKGMAWLDEQMQVLSDESSALIDLAATVSEDGQAPAVVEQASVNQLRLVGV